MGRNKPGLLYQDYLRPIVLPSSPRWISEPSAACTPILIAPTGQVCTRRGGLLNAIHDFWQIHRVVVEARQIVR